MQLSLCIWLSQFSLRSNSKETDSTLQAIIRTTEAVEEALSEAEVVILHAVVVSHNTRHNKMPLVCQICGRSGHTALKCYNRFDNNYQGTAYTLVCVDESGREWYPDSGASVHVTSSP